MFGRNRAPRWMTYAEAWRLECVGEATRKLRRNVVLIALTALGLWLGQGHWIVWPLTAAGVWLLWNTGRWLRFRSKARRGLIYPPEFAQQLGPGHPRPEPERGWRHG